MRILRERPAEKEREVKYEAREAAERPSGGAQREAGGRGGEEGGERTAERLERGGGGRGEGDPQERSVLLHGVRALAIPPNLCVRITNTGASIH